ncbi:hypothetical protein [Hymenobacter cavernae]|uniref:Uncharacterized protein n=1 Tax=Hymenobacter cavernae TaxID=2044852 RepID=A0ABQ1TR09_9BACT|nr:hypothetical protein [Hymenobacter cavernae]GGF00777.1 hypothetical protein GCM10011383_09480 [Hymenobacter cavernae]
MRTYKEPEPRSHASWCNDLGLVCKGKGCYTNQVLTYDEFCFLPDTILVKAKEAPLYGFWRKYGDVYGEPRTVKEWLEDLTLQIVEPLTEQDKQDCHLFLGYDEFWIWSSGKIAL